MKLNFRAFQGLSQAYITSIPHLRLHVLWTAMEYCGYPNSPGTLPFFSSHHPLETFLWTFWICLLKVWSTWLTMLRVFILKTQILRCHAYFPIMFNSSLLTRIGCRNMVFLWLLGDKNSPANYKFISWAAFCKLHLPVILKVVEGIYFSKTSSELILLLVLEKHCPYFLCVMEMRSVVFFSFFVTLFF